MSAIALAKRVRTRANGSVLWYGSAWLEAEEDREVPGQPQMLDVLDVLEELTEDFLRGTAVPEPGRVRIISHSVTEMGWTADKTHLLVTVIAEYVPR